MKLLQIDTCLNTGSTGRITESIAQKAMEQGWDSYIVHGARYTKSGSCMHSFQTVSKWGEYAHYLEGLFFDNHGLASIRGTKDAIEWIRKVNPDLVQLHCIHGYFLNYKLLFEYLNTTSIPVVWTFHDCWSFTGHCAHFVSVDCKKWADKGCHDCPRKGMYPKSLVDRSPRNFNLKKQLFTANKNLHVVTVSKWLQGLAEESFFKGRDIRTIYNGVDTKLFQPLESTVLSKDDRYAGKHVLVAAATAWSKNKGLEDYIKLRKILPDDIIIVLIGLSDEQIASMPEKMIGLKRTESALELAQYYSFADVVMNLSYQETFGLTTAEGLACGTPGIVYNATASPELISPETGLIVKTGDVEGVANAVCAILKNGKSHYSKNCRERAQMLFNKDKQFEEYVRFYEQLYRDNIRKK